MHKDKIKTTDRKIKPLTSYRLEKFKYISELFK